MKKLMIILVFAVLQNSVQAQKLNGLWYSSDSSRVYEIKQTAGNKYSAIIQSSIRKEDKVGYEVIKDLEYNARKKRYEGFIYAVADGVATYVKVRFDKSNTNKLTLKLSRMFVFDVSIDWIRLNA